MFTYTHSYKVFLLTMELRLESVENFHASDISDYLVAGNFYTSIMSFDCTFKERGRQHILEVCLYEVKDGKIASKQYFYTI